MQTESKSRQAWLKLALSLGLAVGVLALLATQITPAEISGLQHTARPQWLGAVLGLYLLSQIGRGWRLHTLTRGASPLWRMASVAGLQNLLIALLPLRGGEVTFVALLCREARISAAGASKILVAVRVMDLLAVCALLVVATAVTTDLPPMARLALPPAAALGIAALSVLLWPGPLANLLRRPVLWVTRHPRLSRLPLTGRLQGYLDRLLQVQDQPRFRRRIPFLLLQSLLIWLVVVGTNYACLRSLGLMPSASAITYLSLLLVLSSVLPIHGWGGFGPQDAIGAGLLMTLGYERASAIATQLTWHAELIIASAISGLSGWALLRAIPDRTRDNK